MNPSELWITVFVLLIFSTLALAGSIIGDVGHIWCDADASCRVLSQQRDEMKGIANSMNSLVNIQHDMRKYAFDAHHNILARQTEALEKIALKLEAISQALLPPSSPPPPSSDSTAVN